MKKILIFQCPCCHKSFPNFPHLVNHARKHGHDINFKG